MRKNSWLIAYCVFILSCCVSCSNENAHNISIHVSDSERYYKMFAHFNRNKTDEVDRFMDFKLSSRSNMSFENSRIDGTLALDDHTTFYIKKYPGYLEIKFDKDKNSVESYQRMKSMCEGIKKLIAN